jgi:hypothetical protein
MTELEAVQCKAITAWHTVELKRREALKMVLRLTGEMAELERFIRGQNTNQQPKK